MAPTRQLFLALSLLIDFFEHVGNLLLIQKKILRISNLLFRLKYFPKTLFFALPPVYANSVPGRDFGSRRDILRNNF